MKPVKTPEVFKSSEIDVDEPEEDNFADLLLMDVNVDDDEGYDGAPETPIFHHQRIHGRCR